MPKTLKILSRNEKFRDDLFLNHYMDSNNKKDPEVRATLNHEDDTFRTVSPHTTNASKHFGKNENWPISRLQENKFRTQTRHSKHHVIEHKPSGKRWLISANRINGVATYHDQDNKPFSPKELVEHYPTLKDHFRSLNNHIINTDARVATPEETNYHLAKGNPDAMQAMSHMKELHSKELSKYTQNPSEYVKAMVAQHPNLGENNINLMMNGSKYLKSRVALNPNLSPDHISMLMHEGSQAAKMNLAYHPNLTNEHKNALAGDKNPVVREHALTHIKLPVEKMNSIIKSKNHADVRALANNKHLIPVHKEIVMRAAQKLFNKD